MAQENPQSMNPAEITEEFRLSSQKIGQQREATGTVDVDLSRRVDLLEQEILRRMAW